MRTSKNKLNIQGEWLTATETIKALECARASFYAWSKLPGAPQPNNEHKHNLKAWRKFVIKWGLGRSVNPQLSELKAQRLVVEIETARFALEKRKRQYMLASDVKADWDKRMSRSLEILLAKFEGEMPPLYEGKTAPENMKLNRQALWEALTEMGKIRTSGDSKQD